MSDSHKDYESMLETVALETPDYILHLGDHERDCNHVRAEFPDIPLRAVRGNCDGFSMELDIDEFVLEGKHFLMAHGHQFGVKAGLMRLIDYAEARNADILLYGHTHVSHVGAWQDMQIVNPGSIGHGRNQTYAIIEMQRGSVNCEIRKRP